MRPRLMPLALTAALLLGACGDDELSRDEFIDELTTVGEMDEERATCVYEEIAGLDAVLDDIADNGSEDLTAETEEALELAVARCVLRESEAEDNGTGE